MCVSQFCNITDPQSFCLEISTEVICLLTHTHARVHARTHVYTYMCLNGKQSPGHRYMHTLYLIIAVTKVSRHIVKLQYIVMERIK